ncbi:hypothetical protein MRQ36_12860 [Micromonospora sp. R77]|uniref:hypothetical protein n=1 Tax=Micromonospora sp. R77 TaxID=2925836 RepID=UPI001F613CCB|nr:hypothetical protein [Micromonospora sp. R77]MCI4063417.1 hypothetical protein [Micromonospora sp. R77]
MRKGEGREGAVSPGSVVGTTAGVADPYATTETNRSRVGRVAAYGAAVAMTPYFVMKIFWTMDGLRGGGLHEGAWSHLDWAVVNGLTVVMSGLAMLLGLALAQLWGLRVPAWLMLLPAWIGMGFLVPVIPLIPVLALITETGGTTGEAPMSAGETALLSVSFAGFALGVAIAAPVYAARRWPEAFSGGAVSRLGLRVTMARLAAALCVALGLPQLFWALGGTFGLNGATLAGRDVRWHLLTANGAVWALCAAAGLWRLTRRVSRATLLLSWLASGFLFAWGSWKATFSFAVAPESPSPEQPWVSTLENHFGAVAGLLILVVVLLTVAERRPPTGVLPAQSGPSADSSSRATAAGRVTIAR